MGGGGTQDGVDGVGQVTSSNGKAVPRSPLGPARVKDAERGGEGYGGPVSV